LFVLLAAGLSLVRPDLKGFPNFLFLVFLLNTFLPSASFVVWEAVWVGWHTRWRHRLAFLLAIPSFMGKADYILGATAAGLMEFLRETWHSSQYGLWYVGFLFLGAISQNLGALFPWLGLVTPILAWASYWLMSRLLGRVRVSALGAASVYGLALDFWLFHPVSPAALGHALLRWSWFGAIGALYYRCSASVRSAKESGPEPYVGWDCFVVKPEYVLPWSLLDETEWRRIEQADPNFYERYFARSRYPDGVTPRQLRLLKAWWRRYRIGGVQVQRAMPFGPWLALGAALTLWTGVDCLELLSRLF